MSESVLPDWEGRTLICGDFAAELARLRGEDWRVDVIWPAEEPHTALLGKDDGGTTRLTSHPGDPEPGPRLPPFRPEFVLTRDADEAGEGRAGMRYRDLIPGRLGGRYIASHISTAGGGPVDDWVHYHAVAFQMIHVRKGWVRVVYEDQGGPFVMQAGDLVLQPPYIRHRVLESSAGLEVIEIGCPALHCTFGDHELQIPNLSVPERLFSGQRFLRHVAAETPRTPLDAGEAQETGMKAATGGLAEVRVIRGGPIRFEPHDGELVFGFVLNGSAQLEAGQRQIIDAGDAFVFPPSEAWAVTDASLDFQLLHVTTAHMPDEIPGPSAKSA